MRLPVGTADGPRIARAPMPSQPYSQIGSSLLPVYGFDAPRVGPASDFDRSSYLVAIPRARVATSGVVRILEHSPDPGGFA